MIDDKELEFKYKADEVKLTDFQILADELLPTKRLVASSWDVYYVKQGEPDYFMRFRDSDTPELTKKRKTKDSNNWVRVEVDLPLDVNKVNEELVTSFVGLDDYKKNFKIYKSCFIYWFENTNMVYYTVYNENLKEIGRYIEVEVNKDKVSSLGIDKAQEELYIIERKLEKLNINPKNRMKRSLYEIYKTI